MCGIWACIHRHPLLSPCSYETHANKVQRRGPDKTLTVEHPYFYMAFHRLAFHDLSPLGDQPMVWEEEDTTLYLMANAEIYNYRELVQHYGWTMRSQSDVEVLYHLYQHFEGDMEKVVHTLDGEFAFVLVVVHNNDDDIQRVVAARDPYGVRPLFYTASDESFRFSSLAQGLCGDVDVQPFPPGTVLSIDAQGNMDWKTYHHMPEPSSVNLPSKTLCDLVIDAVRKRTTGERPMACLLSGGLDSSLVCGILVHVLGYRDLHTFSIGMEGSTDLVYAQQVADYLGTQHHTVHFTAAQGLEAIDEVITACETWDITTIRASTPQFLLAKHISEHTDFRAILNGDGADEAMMGYLYWYNAPTRLDAHLDSVRRLHDIYRYDGLRVDRCLGHFGLEARVPYLDKALVDAVLSTPISERMPTPTRMEKFMIREAFATHHPGILPDSVLWRKKEAFSDGVSSRENSWYRILLDDMEARITDEEFQSVPLGLPEIPPTKEAYYYQKTFLRTLGHQPLLLSEYWLPRWSGNVREPSARVLSVYSETPNNSLPVSETPGPQNTASSAPNKM